MTDVEFTPLDSDRPPSRRAVPPATPTSPA